MYHGDLWFNLILLDPQWNNTLNTSERSLYWSFLYTCIHVPRNNWKYPVSANHLPLWAGFGMDQLGYGPDLRRIRKNPPLCGTLAEGWRLASTYQDYPVDPDTVRLGGWVPGLFWKSTIGIKKYNHEENPCIALPDCSDLSFIQPGQLKKIMKLCLGKNLILIWLFL